MKIPNFFHSNMVLQRNALLPIWGDGEPSEKVEIHFAGKVYRTVADGKGRWSVTMEPLDAGGPFSLEIIGNEKNIFENILIGDVWLCSGQSNMEWQFQQCDSFSTDVVNCENDQIRFFTSPRKPSAYPENNILGSWSSCNKNSAKSFSAVGYYFGKKLQEDLKIPIGLINSSWGGTAAEAWTSKEGLLANEKLQKYTDKLKEYLKISPEDYVNLRKKARQEFMDSLPQDAGNFGFDKGWHQNHLNDSDWGEMQIPNYWVNQGYNTNGVFWFRKEVEIPCEWDGHDLELHLGIVDKSDDTYFNGELIGGIKWVDREDSWNTPRVYTISADKIVRGKNIIAVRVLSNYTGGGICGFADDLYLKNRNTKHLIRIDGKWKFKIEQDFGRITSPTEPSEIQEHKAPTYLFNGMIAPLIPMPIKGVIWYQGESNADDAETYRDLFPDMIRDWRKKWNYDFPFYFVQLANYGRGERALDYDNLAWAWLREAQMEALKLDNTGYAITIDIGEELDIHPKNKKDVGLRLALNALAQTYNKSVSYLGPEYKEFYVKNGCLHVVFSNAKGLHSKSKDLRSFVIAGEDRVFWEAKAVIEGEEVVLSSNKVESPIAVRYAWANSPSCSLYNEAQLPAVPFRSDHWSV